MKKHNQYGFGLVEGLLILIAVTLLGFVGYYVYHNQQSTDKRLDSSVSSSPSNTKRTFEKKADPTASWTAYTSPSGQFKLKYPSGWVQPTSRDLCDSSSFNYGLYLGPDSASVLRCGTDNGWGQITVISANDDLGAYDFSDGYTGVQKKIIIVDGVKGQRVSALASGQGQLLGSLTDGTVVVEYSFAANNRHYVAHYFQAPAGENPSKNVLSDFDTMITKTLKFE